MVKNNTSDLGGVGVDNNPIITALLHAGETKPIVISGYASAIPGLVANEGDEPIAIRIYSSLEDLTAWHEIKSSAVIYRVTPVNPLQPSTFFLKSDAEVAQYHPAQFDEQAKFISGSLMARYFSSLVPTGEAPVQTLLCHPNGPPAPVLTGPCRPAVLTGPCRSVEVPVPYVLTGPCR